MTLDELVERFGIRRSQTHTAMRCSTPQCTNGLGSVDCGTAFKEHGMAAWVRWRRSASTTSSTSTRAGRCRVEWLWSSVPDEIFHTPTTRPRSVTQFRICWVRSALAFSVMAGFGGAGGLAAATGDVSVSVAAAFAKTCGVSTIGAGDCGSGNARAVDATCQQGSSAQAAQQYHRDGSKHA